ncbi:MAG: alpha-glucosidase [Clostridia bacterium]
MEIKKNWYKEMSVYQIWPRSFKDGNGDGIGDLKGVLDKLDYIKSLGIDAIWFSPLYKSPQCDYGYDIADYRDIAPEYGTLDDFKQVISACKERGLRIIMDLVVNHTSDQHQWFLESRKGGDNNPYKDYYIWRKGRGRDGKKPPNNWTATFPGPAWQWDAIRKEYYLHLFAVEQPDLNMDNPNVRKEVVDIMKFWLDLGVDGFREDVITFISKEEGLPNGSMFMPAARGMTHYINGPHIHEYLNQFKAEAISKYDCMTVGEAPMMTPKTALKYITEGDKQELNMMFNFQHMEADCFMYSWVFTGFRLKKLKKALSNWQTKLYGKAWNALYIENHDQPRVISRYGNEAYRAESGKMLANMYLFLGGTPFIYQGQEIGMTNIRIPKLEDYVDVSTTTTYKLFRKLGFTHDFTMRRAMYSSRDNARTPMQWSAEKNAGFTTAEKPWFLINKNYTEVNVADSLNDKNSLLNYYKSLLRLRKDNPIIIYGSYVEYLHNSKKLYVYERQLDNQRLLVINSFVEGAVKFKAPNGIDLSKWKLLISNYSDCAISNNSFITRPYETRTYILNK